MLSQVTVLLREWAGGNPGALEQLTPLIYDQMRGIARRHMRHRARETLQTTALVHEAYLRLMAAEGLCWRDRAHSWLWLHK